MAYSDLTPGEQAAWDEYTGLRKITKWKGFDDTLERNKLEARKWLEDRREELKKEKKPNAKQRARIAQLSNKNLNKGAPKHEVRLPATGDLTDAEKAHIEAREVYAAIQTETEEQRKRKVRNSDWLVRRRKALWRLRKAEPNSDMDGARKRRYEDLSIATRFGPAYDRWNKEHNKWGVKPKPEEKGGRAECVKWCHSHLGTSERPAGSNKGHPQPSGWQKRVYGDDGVAWCACFTVCSAWDNGVSGQGTASVNLNMNLAKRGQGIYRGWTTDPSRVRPGDHAIVSCGTCHTEVVVGNPWDCIGGNTSPGSEGSQFNGGTVAHRDRRGQIIGWALVRFEG